MPMFEVYMVDLAKEPVPWLRLYSHTQSHCLHDNEPNSWQFVVSPSQLLYFNPTLILFQSYFSPVSILFFLRLS
jgi:hypothetical protein